MRAMTSAMNWSDKTILITGGTGSFGKAFLRAMLEEYHPQTVRIYSRDELKQHEMRLLFGEDVPRYLVGDVRDEIRLRRALEGVDIAVHAAALKQVPACEYNPFEAVKTNILGAQNLANAALDVGVPRVIAISTDKAVNPVNLYGATKLCQERIIVQANVYSGGRDVRFACVRYGNVVGSRGSVVPLFVEQRKAGALTITHPDMTRFWITLPQAVRFVCSCIEAMHGGEVFVPKIPSTRVVDLARVIGPGCEQKIVGIRPGEKIHEVLLTEEESRHSVELDDRYIVEPEFHWWDAQARRPPGARPLPDGFRYGSNTNSDWLSQERLYELLLQEGFLTESDPRPSPVPS